MRFFVSETEYIYIGQPYLSKNNIFFESSGYYSDTVIQFGNWEQELNVDSTTRTIISFEAMISPKKIKKTKLFIPEFTNAQIKVDFIEDMQHLQVHYDENSGWFCFGNEKFDGKGYQFATNTIAGINQNKIEAIFIKPTTKIC